MYVPRIPPVLYDSFFLEFAIEDLFWWNLTFIAYSLLIFFFEGTENYIGWGRG